MNSFDLCVRSFWHGKLQIDYYGGHCVEAVFAVVPATSYSFFGVLDRSHGVRRSLVMQYVFCVGSISSLCVITPFLISGRSFYLHFISFNVGFSGCGRISKVFFPFTFRRDSPRALSRSITLMPAPTKTTSLCCTRTATTNRVSNTSKRNRKRRKATAATHPLRTRRKVVAAACHKSVACLRPNPPPWRATRSVTLFRAQRQMCEECPRALHKVNIVAAIFAFLMLLYRIFMHAFLYCYHSSKSIFVAFYSDLNASVPGMPRHFHKMSLYHVVTTCKENARSDTSLHHCFLRATDCQLHPKKDHHVPPLLLSTVVHAYGRVCV